MRSRVGRKGLSLYHVGAFREMGHSGLLAVDTEQFKRPDRRLHSSTRKVTEIGPQSQIDIRELGERTYVWCVQLYEALAYVLIQVDGMCSGVHAVPDPLEDKGIQSEEPVRAGKFSDGIRHASLVLQDQDLLWWKVRSPTTECIVIEAAGHSVLIDLRRHTPAVAALVGKP